MVQEPENLDRIDPQWRLLLVDVVNTLERLKLAKDEVSMRERDVASLMQVARRMLTENKEP